MKVPIGRIGFITNAKDARESYVFVQDDDEFNTGGYLILTSSNISFTPGFDDWILKENLEHFFEASGWNVEWEPGPPRATPQSQPKESFA